MLQKIKDRIEFLQANLVHACPNRSDYMLEEVAFLQSLVTEEDDE